MTVTTAMPRLTMRPTPLERAMGRFMRAPDHDAGTGDGGEAGSEAGTTETTDTAQTDTGADTAAADTTETTGDDESLMGGAGKESHENREKLEYDNRNGLEVDLSILPGHHATDAAAPAPEAVPASTDEKPAGQDGAQDMNMQHEGHRMPGMDHSQHGAAPAETTN